MLSHCHIKSSGGRKSKIVNNPILAGSERNGLINFIGFLHTNRNRMILSGEQTFFGMKVRRAVKRVYA